MKFLSHINWGRALAIVNIVMSVAISIGYLFAGDLKRAAYWFFASCITATVTLW